MSQARTSDAPPTMYERQVPSDGLSTGLTGLQAPPGGLAPVGVQNAPLAQRAAGACCSDGHAFNLATVFVNVVVASLVLAGNRDGAEEGIDAPYSE